jgi:hypothetical protein
MAKSQPLTPEEFNLLWFCGALAYIMLNEGQDEYLEDIEEGIKTSGHDGDPVYWDGGDEIRQWLDDQFDLGNDILNT